MHTDERESPIMIAYLDNAASTRLDPEVAEVMALASALGNPSSLHSLGREAKQLLDEARASVAGQLGVTPEQITFTSGATESDNLAVLGVARAARERGRHVITSTIEHSAVRGPMNLLECEGFEVTRVAVDEEGRIDPGDVASACRADTVLVSIVLANNEIGTVQPAAEIKQAIGEVPLHLDAAQANGKIALNLDDLGADLLTLSGHKMHGPRGVGVLCRRPHVHLIPIMFGGSHEAGLRPGTENVAAAIGFAHAFARAQRHLGANVARMDAQRSALRNGLAAALPDAVFNGSETHRLPTIVNVSIPGVEGEALVLALDAEGVAASSGSACDSHSVEPSPVLRAIGRDDELARGSIRLSVSSDTSDAEIEHAVEVVPRVVRRFSEALRSKQ